MRFRGAGWHIWLAVTVFMLNSTNCSLWVHIKQTLISLCTVSWRLFLPDCSFGILFCDQEYTGSVRSYLFCFVMP